ncbi:MAG: universal stress protein [Longimonas sp.]|uniref:universal stress protein n=1 Tax=Longimonas sp. TaxID=2039626 RepID=UPI003975B619
MINDLLVARDFSTSSDRALHAAFAWARPIGSTVHLLAIQVTNDNPFEPAEQRSGPLERLREQLKDRTHSDMAQSGYDPGSVSVKHDVQRGEAAGPAIVRYAERAEIDLIMMGTTGRRGVRRAMLGSVAEEVVRTAPCPVCTVRATDEGKPPTVPERVVIPVDFSAPSRPALAYGLHLAQQVNADATIVHAIEEPSAPLIYGIEVGEKTKSSGSEALKDRVHRALNEWVEQATADLGNPPSCDVQVHTSAPAAAIREVASSPSDVVVMATEGRTGMERMVLGSVAESVLRQAVGPVITARSFAEVL